MKQEIARNDTSLYQNRTSKDLKTLRSKKMVEIENIRGSNSYFETRDTLRLKQQIKAIDAELKRRALQISLL